MAQAILRPALRALISAGFGSVSVEMTALEPAAHAHLIDQDVFCDAPAQWRKRSGRRDRTTLHRPW
jgi:hypothetical protein